MIDISIAKCNVCICKSGLLQEWHKRNRGNLTYSLMAEEAERKHCFDVQNRPWMNMGIAKVRMRKGDVCHAL